jgi:chemotaxis response regulator CheB
MLPRRPVLAGSLLSLPAARHRADTFASMEAKIRVVVANRPRLLRELVLTTISEQPDIEIVGVARNEEEILRVVERTRPDYLIIAMEESDQRPVICDFVLERLPQLKILAIAPDRNTSMFYWSALDIRCQAVESSEEGILSALRGGETHTESES